ncbi:MAG: hypothetical protein IPJ81_16370 [Chitinophagaceae bacterium]|nr:hypothetical protein [Chitinophagaceae bacterium]
MNYIFFDENFKFVPYDAVTGLGSYSAAVAQPGNGKHIQVSNVKAPKNGYAFIYLSNSSNINVYFDNLDIVHERSRLVEENTYYPYGLKIKSISGKAFGKLENKKGYQGDYSEEDTETGWNEFDLRMYNAQIGRWNSADPYEQYASPYLAMGNNPANLVDPDGGFSLDFGTLGDITGSVLGDRLLSAGAGALIGYGVDKLTGGKGWKGAAIGAGAGFGATFIPPINFGNIGNALSKAGSNIIQGAGIVANAVGNSYAMYASYNNSLTNNGLVRKDGSILFANQNQAYSWMFLQSISNNYREEFGVILKNSVLVLPSYKNTSSESTPENYGYSWKDGNIYDPVSKTTLSTIATIHTHLNPDPYYYNAPNGADQAYFSSKTPNKPFLTMAKNGYVYGMYGKYVNGVAETKEIAFDRGGIPRVTNTAIMKNFALREYLQWYMKNIAK